MTINRTLKKTIRARMKDTGEPYTLARDKYLRGKVTSGRTFLFSEDVPAWSDHNEENGHIKVAQKDLAGFVNSVREAFPNALFMTVENTTFEIQSESTLDTDSSELKATWIPTVREEPRVLHIALDGPIPFDSNDVLSSVAYAVYVERASQEVHHNELPLEPIFVLLDLDEDWMQGHRDAKYAEVVRKGRGLQIFAVRVSAS